MILRALTATHCVGPSRAPVSTFRSQLPVATPAVLFP